MLRKNIKYVSLLFLVFILVISTILPVQAAIGKKTYAKNKYIWVYINGERKIIPSGHGYPCYGQGTDNKNILYIPLSILTDMSGCELSPLKKQLGTNGEYTYYAEVTGEKNFTVELYSDEIAGTKLAGKTFILKGTDAAKTNVIMVPLGFAKDFFGLNTEVKRPIGRGVYDYCSLAINITGETEGSDDSVLTPPSSGEGDENNPGSDTIYFVHAQDAYYHLGTCTSLLNDTLRAQLSEYECIYWGYTKCPSCLGVSGNTVQPVPTTEPSNSEDFSQEEIISDEMNFEENSGI